MDTIDFLVKKALSRRAFVAGAGSVAAATAIAGCSDDGTVTLPVASTSYTDNDILNFALNTEYVEAEFYMRAATGAGLNAADTTAGSSSTSTLGTVNAPATTKLTGLTTAQQNMVNEIAYTEQEHVRALRSVLGANAIARPAIDLVAGFTGIVTAANNISSTAAPTLPTTFSPFASFDAFAVGAAGFEDVGVTAYNGAAPLISTAGITAGILAAAGGILAKEAYSGGMLRSYLTANAITLGSTAYPYAGYYNRIGLLFNALSGGYGSLALSGFTTTAITTPGTTPSTVVPADTNALAFHRTTDQVLHILYGTYSTTSGSTTPSAGVSAGGFFPGGFNGNIKITQS